MVQNKHELNLSQRVVIIKTKRRLVAHKWWGGIYNGTSRQRGFGGVFIGRRFQGGGFWGSLAKVATSVGKKVAVTAGYLGKKAMSLGKQAVTELGKKGKQAATELGKTAVRGLAKQAEKQAGKIAKLAKSGKLKRKAVEAVTKVIPEKVGKFGTKQIIKTIEKAVGNNQKKKKRHLHQKKFHQDFQKKFPLQSDLVLERSPRKKELERSPHQEVQ